MSAPAEPTRRKMNRFERHPKRTGFIALLALLLIVAVGAEVTLRMIGLGNPVLYDTDPKYGYRPRPNQNVQRFNGASVRINNLGLRASSDWSADPRRKVLFLGNSVVYGGSYVSTGEIFASRAVPSGGDWQGASGGVNGWGVENIRGLIVGQDFTPAQTVVLVLIDDDFYRGLAQRPSFFWTRKPVLAIQEAFPHVLYKVQSILHPPPSRIPPSSASAGAVVAHRDSVARAVSSLLDIVQHLRSRGYRVIVYMSPYLAHLQHTAAPDTLISRLLEQSGVHVEYLAGRPQLTHLTAPQLPELYHDGVHLSPTGHALWAGMIRRDLDTLTRNWTR